MTHRVLLVPGFFAFEEIGDLRYFWNVRQVIEDAYRERGEDVIVREVATLPTASIRHRAAKVLDAAAALIEEGQGPLHVVGHSTGGLDARLAIAPTASLPTESSTEGVLDRVYSVVTVSTPHGGSPLASFFASVAGKPLLRVLTATAAVILERGELPTRAAVKLGDMVRTADNIIGLKATALDELYDSLLSDLSEERRELIVGLLREIGDDTSLVFQLTPEGVDLLDAATGDPDHTRYGCVVTRAPKPRLQTVLKHKHDVYAQALHALFFLLSTITSRSRSDATIDERHIPGLEAAYGQLPSYEDHDGLVPVMSQLWGDLVDAVTADHLDVVGHYGDPERRTTDWLPADTGFDASAFREVWSKIVDYQLDAAASLSAEDAAVAQAKRAGTG